MAMHELTLDQLTGEAAVTNVSEVALRMKIKDGSGAPLRIIAFVD